MNLKMINLITFAILLSSFAHAHQFLTDGIVKKDLRLKPEALVREYVKRDSEGEFLQTNQWWKTAVACPNCMGGPDEFTVISAYDIKKNSNLDYMVTYEIEGKVSGDSFVPSKKQEGRSFSVVKTKWGYKLENKSFQMVKAEVALKEYEATLNSESRSLLKAIKSK